MDTAGVGASDPDGRHDAGGDAVAKGGRRATVGLCGPAEGRVSGSQGRIWNRQTRWLGFMVGVDPTDAERLEHWRPDVSVPIVQTVGGHAEARGAFCGGRGT